MTQESFKEDHHLSAKLEEYHVDIPDFPMKPSRWARFIRFMASPAKDPLEPFISSENGVMMLKFVPIMGVAAITLTHIFIH
ncbi:hypothetical protein [Bacillus piscicola]|uniref:hypothetical protein n=1 Tax=Bacillus piscicola TaxID=1632684 RepID=UPI001F091554|nr:hypothetical protein [Bacillus piscicola]